LPFSIQVSGPRACFARPEFRTDCISYDVITPLAARRILEAIYWRRDMRWHIARIVVLLPIQFDCFPSNSELAKEGATVQRQVLSDVAYRIDAHFQLLDSANSNAAQHTQMFLRALRQRRFYQRPFLGLPEYAAEVRAVEDGETLVSSYAASESAQDLGWMTHDFWSGELSFFRATMNRGVINVPPGGSQELAR
jgi:CRISPR-associated protein Cas5d